MKLSARFVLAAALTMPLSLAAATISGTVMDRTTNKPATGDTVVLLDLAQNMSEAGRTTVNAEGHYSFTVPDAQGMHLVRVEHQKADYYGSVPPNTSTVNIDVYDVAPKVEGVHVYADVARMQTDQQGLNVTENYFIRNESKPPRTQFSPHAFEFYLPDGAVVEGGGATGPGGMEVANSPVPLGDKGHYAFVFPLRPGETEFQVAYRLPYTGSFAFHPRVSMPTDNVAVMLPTSMSFQGSQFQPLHGDADEPGTQTYLATNVQPDTTVAYTVSGTGSMPREAQNGQAAQGGQGMPGDDQTGQAGADQPAVSNAPGGGLAPPIDTPDPLQKYKWWILSGIGLILVVGAAFMLRARPGVQVAAAGGAPAASPLTPTLPPGVKATAYRAQVATAAQHAAPAATQHAAPAATHNGAPQKGAMLAALKEELFALETERLEGKITPEKYAQLKSALEVVMRRALEREAATRNQA